MSAQPSQLSVYIGTYSRGPGNGIFRSRLDLGSGRLAPAQVAAEVDRPSFVAIHPNRRFLYSVSDDGSLHFLADSNAAITKGIIALILLIVQDQPPADILATDIEAALAPFDLRNQLSSNRTQGIPNMIALIRATAQRYAK